MPHRKWGFVSGQTFGFIQVDIDEVSVVSPLSQTNVAMKILNKVHLSKFNFFYIFVAPIIKFEFFIASIVIFDIYLNWFRFWKKSAQGTIALQIIDSLLISIYVNRTDMPGRF